jgi:hypothetical protein
MNRINWGPLIVFGLMCVAIGGLAGAGYLGVDPTPAELCTVQIQDSELRIKTAIREAINKGAVDHGATVERSMRTLERRMIAAERRAEREAANVWWTKTERTR